ncbi:TPA: hypothetical protein ACOEAK_001649 [Enterobacter ludwigii]|uniref:hypothetical protein n=1 Tax=Enterobacter ludwigii TaxID=299767 RepID=UPI002A7602B8|nr:hypothetical protein [Enterobacter ludwigii]MDY3574986.1 hypothetical protein [Enterobacter ludwigii]
MPIELKKIPEKIPLPEPPSAFRWFITIVLISVLGGILALYLWPEKMSTHSAWFWFCIFVIPLSTGLACYAFRLRAYENERDRVNYWNHLHQEQHDIQVKRGRRPAGLLGKAYITPIACNKLASALINHGSQLQSTYFAHFQQAFTTARLEPSTSHFLKEGYSTRLTGYITQLLRMLEPDLSVLPADRLSVRLRHDGSLDNMQITQIWQAIFPATYHMDSIVVEQEGDGIMWLDALLDQHEKVLMLSVEINLFVDPVDYQSESVSALLLASPAWLVQHDVKPEVVIHRPVIATEDVSTLEDMLRWGKLSAEEAHTLWRWRVDKGAMTRLIQQSERLGYSPGQNEGYMPDDLFGNPGASLGNIALLCACEYAMTYGKPQWVIMTDKTTHQAIVRQEEC